MSSVKITHGSVTPADQSIWTSAVHEATEILSKAGKAGKATLDDVAHLATKIYNLKNTSSYKYIRQKGREATAEGFHLLGDELRFGTRVAEDAATLGLAGL